MDRGAHAALVWACAACACAPSSIFYCQDDEVCGAANSGGVCEPSGYCSFPDEACGSGRRYGDWAGDGLSGTCVEDPDPGSSTDSANPTSTTAAPGPATDTTSSDGSGADATSSESTRGEQSCPEGWWDCAWTRRQALTLQAMPHVDPLTALPVPLRPDPSMLRDSSLTFVDASGATLPWEREGNLVWVAVDVEPNTPVALWAYGSNPNPPPASPTPVWDGSYVAVWHLADGTDATGSGNVAVSAEAAHDEGYLDDGAVMDGIDDRFDLEATESLADLRAEGFTIEAWILPEPDSADGYRRILEKADGVQATLGWSLMLRGVAPPHRIELDYGYEAAERQYLTEAFEVTDWVHLVVVTHPGDEAEFWVDGAPLSAEVINPGLGMVLTDALQPASIGAPTTGMTDLRFFDGGLDEIRISRGVRSPSWVIGTYTSAQPDAVTVDAIESLAFE